MSHFSISAAERVKKNYVSQTISINSYGYQRCHSNISTPVQLGAELLYQVKKAKMPQFLKKKRIFKYQIYAVFYIYIKLCGKGLGILYRRTYSYSF